MVGVKCFEENKMMRKMSDAMDDEKETWGVGLGHRVHDQKTPLAGTLKLMEQGSRHGIFWADKLGKGIKCTYNKVGTPASTRAWAGGHLLQTLPPGIHLLLFRPWALPYPPSSGTQAGVSRVPLGTQSTKAL